MNESHPKKVEISKFKKGLKLRELAFFCCFFWIGLKVSTNLSTEKISDAIIRDSVLLKLDFFKDFVVVFTSLALKVPSWETKVRPPKSPFESTMMDSFPRPMGNPPGP